MAGSPLSKEAGALYDMVVGHLHIDPDELEAELANNGVIYAFLANSAADAKLARDKAKAYLDQVKAQQFINAKGASFEDGVGKISGLTETLAKAYVDADEDVAAARYNLAVAERQLTWWDSIMSAMEHRSYALTKLADLRYAERRLEAGVFNGQTREDIAKSMNQMANMDAKRKANVLSRQNRLDSIRKPTEDREY